MWIKTKAIIKPIVKLPLSPKNILGSLKKEKLKNKKIPNDVNINIKNRLKLRSSIKNINMQIIEIVVSVNVPSKPSK